MRRAKEAYLNMMTAHRNSQRSNMARSSSAVVSKNDDATVRNPRVAIVHDWLVGGGAEQVVLELHKLYPDAPIYTSYCTPEWREKLDDKVITGWLQHLGKIRKFIPLLRIWWFTRLDFAGYDLVISSSGNGEAFGIKLFNF